ncbi:hypothetical protein AXK12_03135 [Cephaloticoccus capnophilus]|uniref:Uncharacterized protein n=1 Tax=Cephaloticoccus capnophilus TaxID=1548208 RepID=A0A139SPT5_9BACT|nr:Imm9 family immunity protein [Cephaloticoccus capnophilus]KXU36615.1 hypothetical protein AXK12_03135 [Cephaloticoccus capnophilus]
MKNKKVKQLSIGLGIEVVGLTKFADVFSTDKKIATYVKSILPRINIEDLSGWRLQLHISYLPTDSISVYKKFLRYPSDREYVILIGIPIPDNTQAPYGMPTGANGKISLFCRSAGDKHNHLLDPEYDKYADLNQYILAAAIKAIDLGFTKGFTCYGKKIKFQDL